MKNFKWLALSFILLHFSFGFSQTTKELYDIAEKAFASNQYAEAYLNITHISPHIDDLSKSKQENVAYMEAKSAVNLFLSGTDTLITNKYGKNAPLYLFDLCVKESKAINKPQGKGFESEIKRLYPYLYQNAKIALQDQLVNFSDLYLAACKQSDSENKLNEELEARVYLLNEDTLTATRIVDAAIEELQNSEDPNSLKALIGIYFIQAEIFLSENEPLKSYEISLSAYKTLDKYQSISQNAEKSYLRKTKVAIQCVELQSLANIPDRVEEAIRKFEEAIALEPENYSLLMGYGQVLANVDLEKAAEIYKKAINVEPKNYIGYYNLGALYLNEGVKYFEKCQNTTEKNGNREAFFNYQELYGQAYNWMNNAYKLRPDNLSILYALRRLAAGLYYPDEVRKYNMLIEKIEYRKMMKKN